MTTQIETFWDKFDNLSPAQIQNLKERIANQIKLSSPKARVSDTFAQTSANSSHQLSLEAEADALLETLLIIYPSDELLNLTDEEIAEMVNFDPGQLPVAPKSLTEIISENREDRL